MINIIDVFFQLDLSTRKLCTPSMKNCAASVQLLYDYYNSLCPKEQNVFREFSDRYSSWRNMGMRKYKITNNSIYIANRIKNELGISCYPYIEKIATKSWSTRDGTFAWCMKTLESSDFPKEIYSFENAREYLLKKNSISNGSYMSFVNVVSVDRAK